MGKKRRKATAFYDFNIPTDGLPPIERTPVITTALQLGYSGVALNHVVKGPLSNADVCKSRAVNLSEIASAGTEIAQSAQFHRDVLGVSAGSRTFRQYDRLTVVVESAIQAAALNAANPLLRSYDLVAIRPTSQRVFDQACTHLEVDVISLDFLHRLPIRLKALSVKAAVERGIFFEVSFSGAFQDLKARRELFANAQMLQVLTRGRNIIVTSGARRSVDLRGPNDIANVGTLFGLSREAAKASVSKNCEDAISRGLARKKMYKSSIMVDTPPAWGQAGSDESWFDVPKVWDPLSNTKMGEVFLLPEKMQKDSAVEAQKEIVGSMKVHTSGERHHQLDGAKSVFQVGDLGGFEDIDAYAEDKEEGFLSIDLGEAKKGRTAGSRKRGRGGEGKKEKPKAKQSKRKRG